MQKKPLIVLPKEFESFRTEIEATVKPFIKITGENKAAKLFQSKFGGRPYLPLDMEHPTDINGKPMKLLAQLNFEEIPHLEPMPKTGLLQFFASAEDDVTGCDFDNPTNQSNFKVVYHREVIKDDSLLVTDFGYMDAIEEDYFPVTEEAVLSFQLQYEPVGAQDFQFERLLGEEVDFSKEIDHAIAEDLNELYCETFASDGHKMGGYAFFTQSDPREDSSYEEYKQLLLQIDSEDELGIMWGDSGVANFFIREEDLKKMDFSNVLYTWDCC